MTYSAHPSRPLVLRARRETVVLVIAATSLTFALSHAVHRHRPPEQAVARHQAWTGGLADLAAPTVILSSAAPLTSASLVVPQSELALPEPSLRPLVKMRGCGGQACVSKPASVPPLPVRRALAAADSTDSLSDESETVPARRSVPHRAKPGLMTRLNPLNHLPDASAIKRPFVFAGDAVSGWFKRF